MNLKETVLAKCKERWDTENSIKDGHNVHLNSGGWYDIRKWGDDGIIGGHTTIHYRVSKEVPEDSDVWPLAATVLGVGVDEKGHNHVKELLRQAFLQGRDTSGMPEKDALANFHRSEKEYYLPQFGNPQNLIDALQKIACDGHQRDFDAAEFAEIALEDWENNAKPSPKKIEGHTFRQLLEENIRLLKAQLETPKTKEV